MKDLTNQLGRIKKELDEMLKLMLDKKDHTDVTIAIFSANKEIARAEVLLMMKDLTPQQRKELGIDPILGLSNE